jgi:ribonuclease Z
MRRLILVLSIAILLVGALGYAFRRPITLRLVENTVASNLATDLVRELPDGLHAALCGAGSPFADPSRSGPCTAIIAGRQLYIVDAGSGSSRVLTRMRIPQGEIDGIFLTHFHSDHIDGLGELLLQRWAAGANTVPAPVYGPQGVSRIVEGLNLAYASDHRYRVEHHGSQVVPPSGAGARARPFVAPPDGDGVVLIDGELKVTAFRVRHEPVQPSVGYRFDYKGRSIVLSGDTTASSNLREFARAADLLIHEALSPQLLALVTRGANAAGRQNLAKITEDVLSYHATPVDAARVARDAGVGRLLYNHIVPPLLLPTMEGIFLDGVEDVFDGPFSIGRDGTLVKLPAGTDSSELVELL